jgi:hypothetical protein
MDWEKDDVRRLRHWYAVANAPTFLYERLSTDPLVKSLSSSHTTDELAKELASILSEPGSLDRNARAYALLVAILLAAPQQAQGLLDGKELTSLYWASTIIRIASAALSSGPETSAKPQSRK